MLLYPILSHPFFSNYLKHVGYCFFTKLGLSDFPGLAEQRRMLCCTSLCNSDRCGVFEFMPSSRLLESLAGAAGASPTKLGALDFKFKCCFHVLT